MGYNTKLADRIREALMHLPDVEEKEMFRGICFMVNGKMCVCVSGDEMLCRIGADQMEAALEANGVRQMVMARSKPSKDFIFVSEDGFRNPKDFDHWIKLALDFNPLAKASKKRK
ncbi:MAG TPA: TfoX/Sxy family protein [Mucilaginibacter sp.]|jgi:TfoX/Sxy family transcriptional regulator of competence genes|nr:TfoX/Sxy family protein [Mucilaginibacter sp.]